MIVGIVKGSVPSNITPYIAATPVWFYASDIKNIMNGISTESSVPSSSDNIYFVLNKIGT